MTENPRDTQRGDLMPVTFGFLKDWYMDQLEKEADGAIKSGQLKAQRAGELLRMAEITLAGLAQFVADGQYKIFVPKPSDEEMRAVLDDEDEDG